MSTPAPLVRKHSDSGLLYTITDGEAAIVGCTLLNRPHLEIPAILSDGEAQYPVTAIGEAAFSYLPALRTIALPGTLRSIGHGAFEHSGLTEALLPDGLTFLGAYAFFHCTQLSRVVLPASGLRSLPEQVFGGCTTLLRRNVTHLSRLSQDDMARCGLQDLGASDAAAPLLPIAAPARASSIGETAPQELLQHGLQLEAEGKDSDAAAFYLQAHDLRTWFAAQEELPSRVEALSVIAEAEYRLGVLLKWGLAPEKNGDGSPRPTPAELLHLASDTGHIADAMYHLGDLYAMGGDASAALRYLKKAAAIGHERACLDLAYAYLDGTLDHACSQTARMYLRKCAALGGPYAAVAAEELAHLESR